MVLILAPLGLASSYEGEQLRGTCQRSHLSFLITRPNTLQIDQAFTRYRIPLPTHTDRIRLSYRLGHSYAYLGNCLAGLAAYVYFDTTCQKVMVVMGPIKPI